MRHARQDARRLKGFPRPGIGATGILVRLRRNGLSLLLSKCGRSSASPEEFQDTMAMAAGHPAHHEGREFSHVKVGIIPDTLIPANPLAAVSQLIGP
jgi:hypothetical protein